MKKILFLSIFCISIISSCQKYREFDDLEIIENLYSGNISISSMGTAGDIDINIIGNGDSGTHSFIWDNRSGDGILSIEDENLFGQIKFVLEDAKGDEVMNEIVITNEDNSFFQASKGKKGKWKVIITVTNFTGDVTFDLGI